MGNPDCEASRLRREIFAEGFLGFGVLVAFAPVEGVGAVANHVRAQTDYIAAAVTYPLFGMGEQVFTDRLRAEYVGDDDAVLVGIGHRREAVRNFLRSGGIGKLAGQVGEARVVFFARGADRSGDVLPR